MYPLKTTILKSIRVYQKYFSLRNPFTRIIYTTGTACRFQPTCSEYTYQAINKFGIIRGSYLGVYRLFRCHPFTKGGFDPVPKKQ